MLSRQLAKLGFAKFSVSQSALKNIEVVFLRLSTEIRANAKKRGVSVNHEHADNKDVWQMLTMPHPEFLGFKEVTRRGNIYDLSFFHLKSLRELVVASILEPQPQHQNDQNDKNYRQPSAFQKFVAKGGYHLVNAGFFVSPATSSPESANNSNNAKNGNKQRAHVDDGSIAQNVEWDHHFPEAFTVVLGLTKSTIENGATSFWPASHLVKPAVAIKSIEPVVPELKPGEGVIFSFRTLHQGGLNLTSKDRVLLYLVFHKRLGLRDKNLEALGPKPALLPVETRSGRGRIVV
jgi:hypothetical protein